MVQGGGVWRRARTTGRCSIRPAARLTEGPLAGLHKVSDTRARRRLSSFVVVVVVVVAAYQGIDSIGTNSCIRRCSSLSPPPSPPSFRRPRDFPPIGPRSSRNGTRRPCSVLFSSAIYSVGDSYTEFVYSLRLSGANGVPRVLVYFTRKINASRATKTHTGAMYPSYSYFLLGKTINESFL